MMLVHVTVFVMIVLHIGIVNAKSIRISIFHWNAAIDHGDKLILVLWKVRLFSTQLSNTSIRYNCLWFFFVVVVFLWWGVTFFSSNLDDLKCIICGSYNRHKYIFF